MATPFSFWRNKNKRTFMTQLDIQTEYLDIECLADRWKCKIGLIEVLAETGKIKCCIRPAAIKNAIKSSRPTTENEKIQLALQHNLEQDEIYKLFSNRTTPQKITSYRKNIPDAPEINVLFTDVIVYVENIEDYENKCGMNDDDDIKILSKDFTYIMWRGRGIKFGETQGKVLKILWEAREAGEPWVYGKRLLTAVGSEAERLRGLFRHNKYWKDIIVSDYRGKYRLNLSPKRSLNGGIGLVQ